MLEHQKLVISNVSHIEPLFRKEITKSLKWLKPKEVVELRQWLMKNYRGIYRDVIYELFPVDSITA